MSQSHNIGLKTFEKIGFLGEFYTFALITCHTRTFVDPGASVTRTLYGHPDQYGPHFIRLEITLVSDQQ